MNITVNKKADLESPRRAEINAVELRVRDILRGRVRDLHLEACDEGVILQGYAKSYYLKQVAQHVVMKAVHLPILRNDIVVC